MPLLQTDTSVFPHEAFFAEKVEWRGVRGGQEAKRPFFAIKIGGKGTEYRHFLFHMGQNNFNL